MNNIITLLFSLSISISAVLAGDNLGFNHLGFETGLSQININGLYQDEIGTLWIGTRDGVKRYNGNTVESIQLAGMNNWSSTAFPTVCGDKKGHVFISIENQIVEYNLQNDMYKTIYTHTKMDSPNPFCFSYGINSLWIALEDTIYLYHNGQTKVYVVLKDKQAIISSIKETSDGKLLLGTKNKGLFCIDSSRKEKLLLTNCSNVISIYEDSKKNNWIGTFSNGLYCIAPNGSVSTYNTDPNKLLKLSNNYVRAICEDNDGSIWVGTMLGLDKLNLSENTVSHYGLSENGKSGLTNLSVWVIMKDNQGTMWFGTFYGGLNYFNPNSISFSYNDFGTHYLGNGYPIIGQIQQDKRGDFWMCTEGKGLLFLNKKTNAYRFFPQKKGGLPTNNLKSIYYDPTNDQLWIGTHLHGLCRLDIKTMAIIQFDIDPLRGSSESEIVHALVKYQNTLFIGTLMGIFQMDLLTNKITAINGIKNKIYIPSSLLVDSTNNLWIAGNKLLSYNILSRKVIDYKNELSKTTNSTANLITALYEDKQGRIIVACTGVGLLTYSRETNNFEVLTNKNNNLTNAYICSISETDNGFYLVGSNNGFSCIDKKTEICYNFNTQNGFPLFSMSPGSIFNTNNKEVFLSGVNGISSFNIDALFVKDLLFRIYFSKLWVNNTLVKPGDKTGVLNDNLSHTKNLVLKYNQNAITIEIGNDNYAKLGHAVFQYRLEGFDKDWTDFSTNDPIKYMNLPFGSYTLRVRAKFEDVLKSPEVQMKIRVTPPFYLTWYAYLLYLIVIVSISSWLIRLSRARLLLQTTLSFEKRDKEHREQVNQSKLRFFTNISHELRTPLTLIIGQLELLLSNKKTNNPQVRLNEIHRSASDMNELINELMDFQKHDQGMFKIRVKEQNIVEFVQDIYTSFNGYAELKEIEFSFNNTNNKILVWFDPIQLRKVFNNLIANAFKYTPKGGSIKLSILKNDTSVSISVIDSGIGISRENNDKVFDRFYQVDNSVNSEIYHTGTGIGLSLSQSIVKAHNGTINVQSEENKGSEFSVELLTGTKHFEGIEMVEMLTTKEEALQIIELNDTDKDFQLEFIEQQKSNFNHLPSILIVEDDDNLRKLLIQIFDPIALTLEANNGIEGLKIAKEKSPDLVISDIMMPGMSGYELCSKLKSDFEICHIPVILLTALSAVDNTVEGLNCGADDYITKPFNVKILVTKCFGLLNNRRLLQEKFSKQIETTAITLTTNPLDQSFVEKIIHIIETNIENGDINISLLCSEMAMSRTRLFAKMKGITGQTPHDFIQNIKLKLAAKMIQEQPEKNITEIADFLGFSSLNYFGKTFKEHFGVSPTSLRKIKQDDFN